MQLGTQDPTQTADLMERMLYEVKRVVVGQDRFLERVLIAMLAQGHLLVEGVPGLAKTLTVKTLARTMRGSFKRIQFTPDLVPADLVGTRIYNQKTGDFGTSLGPGVRQPAAGRRDQPRAGQGAERAARSDAGAPGHDRRRHPPRARALRRHGHAEPDRDRRHLPAARSPGRPLHDEGAGRLPDRGRRVRHRAARHRPVHRGAGGVRHVGAAGAAEGMPRGLCRSVADHSTPSSWSAPRARPSATNWPTWPST